MATIHTPPAGSEVSGRGSTVLTWVDATQVVRFGSEKVAESDTGGRLTASTCVFVGARKGRQVHSSGPHWVGLLAAFVPVIVVNGILGGQLLVVDLVVRLRSRGR